LADVRFGSLADKCTAQRHVRFAPNSDHKSGLSQLAMSALPPIADMCGAAAYVCYGPISDIMRLSLKAKLVANLSGYSFWQIFAPGIFMSRG
jgi:hypothetical protein